MNYRHFPRRTYAVGTSNGGYQVRRAVEVAPDLFNGGVDWEGTFVDPSGPNNPDRPATGNQEDHVEARAPLPASQCIPKGGAISHNPSEPGNCGNRFVP